MDWPRVIACLALSALTSCGKHAPDLAAPSASGADSSGLGSATVVTEVPAAPTSSPSAPPATRLGPQVYGVAGARVTMELRELRPATPPLSRRDIEDGIRRSCTSPARSYTASFAGVTGSITVDDPRRGPEASRAVITVDLASLSTGFENVDRYLKSKDFFDVARYPTAVFTSTDVRGDGATGELVAIGQLEVHGVKKLVSLALRAGRAMADSDVGYVNARGALNRKDFRITSPGGPILPLADGVELGFSLEVTLPRE